MKIGYIGQGFVGKHSADDFEHRGYEVVRYALEATYIGNKEKIKECDIVFIAVPTPSTPTGFEYHIVEEALSLVNEGSIVVIKSTLIPGTTKKLQDLYPNIVVLFSPEFLCEATAAHDSAHPMFTIVGAFSDSVGHQSAANIVMKILPQTEHSFVIPTEAAELFKYSHNIHGFMRVILSNLLYDTAMSLGIDWGHIEQIMNIDPMMSPYYNAPVHKSGRGAGGNCFIKDMAAFAQFYAYLHPEDTSGIAVFKSLEKKNLELLALSNKSQDLVRGVYGEGKENTL